MFTRGPADIQAILYTATMLRYNIFLSLLSRQIHLDSRPSIGPIRSNHIYDKTIALLKAAYRVDIGSADRLAKKC